MIVERCTRKRVSRSRFVIFPVETNKRREGSPLKSNESRKSESLVTKDAAFAGAEIPQNSIGGRVAKRKFERVDHIVTGFPQHAR